jgi:hypothetical protein
LWRESGLSWSELVDELVKLARDAYAEKRRNSYDYRTDLINVAQMKGLKGIKGTKAHSNTQQTARK